MAKINELNDYKYQEIFMLELPKMLKLPCIERFYPFLTRDFAEKDASEKQNAEALLHDKKMTKQTFLSFEDFIHHPKLP